jgi:hypothetical protein
MKARHLHKAHDKTKAQIIGVRIQVFVVELLMGKLPFCNASDLHGTCLLVSGPIGYNEVRCRKDTSPRR